MRRDYIWNTLGSSANSFISLLLLIVVTRVNGIDNSGLFSLCSNYAFLFFVIGIYGGRIYQVSDVNGEFESKNYIFMKFLTGIAMMITAIVFIIVNDYDMERSALLLSLSAYKLTDALADPLYGIVQRKDRLYWAGISMFTKAIIGFVAFVIVDVLTQNIILASLCLLIANILFIFVWDIPKVIKVEQITNLFKGNMAQSLFLIRNSGYVFIIAFLIYLLPNIIRNFVDINHSQATVGWYGIIIMPATLLNLFVSFMIQPKLISLSESYAAKKYADFDRTVSKIIIICILFGVVVTFFVWLIGCPVFSFIYEKDLYPYRLALTLVVLGGTINTLMLVCNYILSIMRKFPIQIIGCIFGVVTAIVASLILVAPGVPNAVNGSIWAFLIAVSIQSAFFVIGYKIILKKQM